MGGYVSFAVRLEDGREELFWPYELEEARKSRLLGPSVGSSSVSRSV